MVVPQGLLFEIRLPRGRAPRPLRFRRQIGRLWAAMLWMTKFFIVRSWSDGFHTRRAGWENPTTEQNGETKMGKRDELIAKYADDLRNKCGMQPDMDLLTKVTIGCGPAIYDADASTVAGSQPSELETVKKNFLMKKLGLADSDDLMGAIDSVIETYGRSERNKYRAVIYYMLTKHFGKESVYG
jgi:hypothetical protein